MDEFKEVVGNITRPLVMLFTFIYLTLACYPFFMVAEDLLWVFVVDDVFYMGWWFVMLLWFCTIIVVLWMLIMVKMGLWE